MKNSNGDDRILNVEKGSKNCKGCVSPICEGDKGNSMIFLSRSRFTSRFINSGVSLFNKNFTEPIHREKRRELTAQCETITPPHRESVVERNSCL